MFSFLVEIIFAEIVKNVDVCNQGRGHNPSSCLGIAQIVIIIFLFLAVSLILGMYIFISIIDTCTFL